MWKKRSLKTKFAFIICTIILVVIGILSLVLITTADRFQSEQSEAFVTSLKSEQNQEEQLLRQGLSQKVESLAALLAQTASYLIMNYDFELLQLLAESTARDPEVVFATFYGEDEKPLSREPDQRKEIETIKQKILYEEELVGFIEIGFSFTSIDKAVSDVSERIENSVQQANTRRTESIRTFMLRILIFGAIGIVFLSVIIYLSFSHLITTPLLTILNATHRLAEGDFTADIRVSQEDEIGILANALRETKDRVCDVLQETDGLIRAVQDGRLDTRGNAEAFRGGWRELVVGVNTMIDAFVSPINVTAKYLERIAQGDVPGKITEEHRGDFNEIKNNLNLLIDNIRSVLRETNGLIQAVQAGKLDIRGNAGSFSGDWWELVVGINNLIDAFVKPLSMTAESLDRIAKGDIPDTITEEYQGDFNEIKNNLNMLIDAMHEMTRLAEEMAEGNLTITIKERSAHDTLMRALNTMVQRLSAIVLSVKGAADSVASGSQAMSSSSEEMSQGANEQAAAAEQVSSSMEEITANIRQNADNALQTEKIAMNAAEDAQKGGQAVARTVSTMQKIVKKISLIEEIARQAHMLSLNATIEAAKAQEYGEGFGVVASEVRTLAERVQSAAVEINAIASDSITVTEQASVVLTTLVPDIQKTANLVQEISAASNEQGTGTKQINQAIQQLDNVIQQNAASSEEMVVTSEELAGQAEMLQDTIAFFKMAETVRKPMDRREEAVRTRPATEAEVQLQGKRVTGDVKKDPGNGRDSTSAGSIIDVDTSEKAKDDLDDEFERF